VSLGLRPGPLVRLSWALRGLAGSALNLSSSGLIILS